MIALIAIPHQTPAQIHWYDDAGTLIAEAEEYADQAGHEPPESHGFDDPLANAAHELADDWHGHLLIRTAADVEELRSYDGHQSCRIAAMLDELADEFAPNPPEPPPTRIDVNDLRGNPVLARPRGGGIVKKDKTMCRGCRDDYYNQNRDKGCWLFASAEIIERTAVGTWDNPPYKWNPRKYLSCYHRSGEHLLKRDDVRMEVPSE